MQSKNNNFSVNDNNVGMRLDKWLSEKTGETRSSIRRRIENHEVKTIGGTIKGNYRVRLGETYFIQEAKEKETIIPKHMPLDICYEDEYLLVVNKPSGQLVHPIHYDDSNSLVSGLLDHAELADTGDSLRPGIVHRLDKDTSGLLLVVKKDELVSTVLEDFAKNNVSRQYLAFVKGVPNHLQGTINENIAKTTYNPLKREVVSVGGRQACTHYKLLAYDPNYSLLRCRLETGRTHQIRVHLSHIGLPIVGDPLYGIKRNKFGFNGQALHAHYLRFIHPVMRTEMEFFAEAPSVFKYAVSTLTDVL